MPQSTADLYLLRRHPNAVLSQSLWVFGSWCAEGLFEPSEHLWQVWGLILNMILPLLPSCWGFSALGHWVSPHRCSSVTQPPDDQYRYQTDDILCSQIWRSSIQSAKTRLGAGCGSDHELLIVKFRLNLKKVGKTTRPFSSSSNSVAQSCLTLWDPINHSTPGLPVHHQLLEFTQTHVHRVCDAIQPSHPLSSPSFPAPNPSQHQGLFQ